MPSFADADISADIENEPLLSDSSLVKAVSEYYGMLCMKVGVEYCLKDGVREPLLSDGTVAYGAPIELEGEVLLPLEPIANWLGYTLTSDGKDSITLSGRGSVITVTLGSLSATVGGSRAELGFAPSFVSDGVKEYAVISKNDVHLLFEDKYVTYDDMGLIVIADRPDVMSRKNGYTAMTTLMKKFIFNYASGDEIYRMVNENTDGFTHPYLYTGDDRFELLKKKYEAYYRGKNDPDYDEILSPYLFSTVISTTNFLRGNSKKDENGNHVGLLVKPVNPHDTPDGYDPEGGRLSVPTDNILQCAITYKVTGNADFARICYDWIVALGEWEHWGPGHFLNCADATYPVAMAYDWLYNDFIDIGLDPSVIADIIFEKGVHMGYLHAIDQPCPYPSEKQGGAYNWGYRFHPNNWNSVCSAGMITAALAIMHDDRYAEECKYLIENNFLYLTLNGLEQYAPDGSYPESASYWSYGTNALFRLAGVLDSAVGTDLGLMDTWGIDKTCYYACHIESSDYVAWGYHDGTTGSVSSIFFPFVASFTNNPELMEIRRMHIENGKKMSVWDLLYYDKVESPVELKLQYQMVGIDAYTVRSSWEKGAIYAGLMGGSNKVSHGQIDAGNFIYYKDGIIWFSDLGADDYNIKGYFSNFKLYKRNAEGQNVLCMTSVPTERRSDFYGQYRHNAVAPIIKSFDNEHGAYAILDTTSVYPSTVTSSTRGMLFTNSRSTVIIQDELRASSPVSFYWFGHVSQRVSRITYSEDGREAYLEARSDVTGNFQKLRVTLLSDDTRLRFKTMTAYDLVLGNDDISQAITYTSEQVDSLGGASEDSRFGQQKLAIEISNITSLRLAVVIEDITDYDGKELGYTLVNMSSWNPKAETRPPKPAEKPIEKPFGGATLKGLNDSRIALNNLSGDGTEFSYNLYSYYLELVKLNYYKNELADRLNNSIGESAVKAYNKHKAKYDSFLERMNGAVHLTERQVYYMFGLKWVEPTE